MNDLRVQLQRNPGIVAVACGVMLLLAIGLGFYLWPRNRSGPRQYQKMVYFYDLNTKELFAMSAGSPSPVETDSGLHQGMPAGVRAEVYCCGNYTGKEDYFIGMLEVSANAVPEDQRPANINLNSESDLFLIRRPDDTRWYRIGSREYKKIMEEARARCSGDEALQSVYPTPVPLD